MLPFIEHKPKFLNMCYLIANTRRFLGLSAFALILFSCSDDGNNDLEYTEDAKVSQTELKTIIETDNVASVADQLVSELYDNEQSGTTAKTEETCYVAEYSETGFTLTFDSCSIEDGGEVLDGVLSVAYGGDNDSYAFVITYDQLIVGNTSIDGTRSFKVNSSEESQSISWTVDSKMEIVLADGSEVSEEGEKTMAIVFGEDFSDGAVTLDGEWILKSDGNTYIVDITDLMEIKFGCEYFGEGVMALSKNGLEVSVDFGDSTCDDIAMLTYPDGTEEEISLKD